MVEDGGVSSDDAVGDVSSAVYVGSLHDDAVLVIRDWMVSVFSSCLSWRGLYLFGGVEGFRCRCGRRCGPGR